MPFSVDAKGKGSDCTPELSGTFLCCGDSLACTTGDEGCYCQTNSPIDTSKTTKYQIQVELLISKEVEKFQHVDLWTISAPACSTLKQYPADDFCSPDHERKELLAQARVVSFTRLRGIMKSRR